MDIKEIALKVAEESGAVCYSPAPFLRAVRGYGLTYEQLQNFAEALIESYKAELLKEVEEPVAWRADVATDFGIEDRYSGWETWLINYEPNCPLGSVRNKTGLFTSDQVAAAVLKATKPLEEEIERLKKHQCAPVCIFHEGDEREELKKQLAAAQEEIRSRDDFIAMLQETQKDQLASCEQRVAEWQPIETAPRDGTRILMRGYGSVVVAGWGAIIGTDAYGWRIVNDAWIHQSDATHWMPLPKAPNGASS